MKTKTIKLMFILFLLGGFTTLQAQGLYNLATLDDEDEKSSIQLNPNLTISGYLDSLEEGVDWADNTIGGSAGFGWNDNDGDSETSFCLSAEFLHKISGEDQNPDGAGYLGAFVSYHNSNSEFFDESYFRAGPKYSYFDRISALNEVQLIYGVKAFYETGSRDFSGFEEDLTGYGASAYTGVNFKISNKVSVGVEVPLLSYLSRTFEANGTEFKTDSFSAAINKDNPITATVRFNLLDKIKDYEFVD